MPLGVELERSLREFAAAGPAEVREGGVRLTTLDGLSWEVRGAPGEPLLHLWSEHCNLTRRVLGIPENSRERLVLSVLRFGRAKPERLEFLRLDFTLSPRVLGREEFCERLARLLAQQFPDEKVESLTIAADLEHSLSGKYARGILRRGSVHHAVLGVPDEDPPGAAEEALTFALLWLERVRQSNRRGSVEGLRLIFPRAAAGAVVHRLAALDPCFSVELYEHDAGRETLEKVDPQHAGNLHSWLVPAREAEALIAQALPALEALLAKAPEAITVHPLAETREVLLRFRGLAFARWADGRVYFGADGARAELTPATRPVLEKLLHDLKLYRHPLANNTRHALYRAHAERWLEAQVAADIARVDPALDPRFVYTQVFAATASDRGVLDLLGVTHTGRLAVLELKASEHIHLPLQAAEYWLRVRRQQLQDGFARYGYFPGIELQQAPPLVYLVAPAIRFHPSTDTLLRFLSPEIEAHRVGVAENWRRGLRIVMRQ